MAEHDCFQGEVRDERGRQDKRSPHQEEAREAHHSGISQPPYPGLPGLVKMHGRQCRFLTYDAGLARYMCWSWVYVWFTYDLRMAKAFLLAWVVASIIETG